MNTTLLTALVLFLTGFIGDIGTQLVAKSQPTVNLFAPYWDRFGPFGAAVIAGGITLVFGGLFLLAAIAIYNALGLETKSWSFVFFATALAFVLGVIGDVITNRNNYIPPLRLWYDQMGATNAAMWSGGLIFTFVAFITSVVYIHIK